MNDPNNTQIKREPYEAPVIEDVPIRAEEVMLVSCKNFVTAVPNFNSCILPAPCSTFTAS